MKYKTFEYFSFYMHWESIMITFKQPVFATQNILVSFP